MASMAQRLGTHSVHSVEALRLYREILRTLRRFDDRATRIYYYNYARTHFMQHQEEEDEERVQEIIERGKNDLRWLKAKYGLDDQEKEEDY
ncbi:complex 1 protein (lyr family) protein [Acanthamoeba castellanii str. Neff]|uniref:Complex 1 protein (Lyr family) protein n=1 Tax=Acanthamoeba castellanii (strain ATCC 30010 / Neff) TaxID=1257118 RepID=L8GED1_ACACF|nr:complex 1 protein (lyr family) protein [Acanthamoeba castellanii str. Neff]ELR11209.1 complex 1 protein (lyr family) protein [Acanthamoeba castellanii str. Neff]